jgi:hypothetical protein
LKLNQNRYTYYHKNVGGEWTKFPPESTKDRDKKVIDLFSETSFLVFADKKNEK